ncbi:MAG: Hsp20/alpha crystallin family protein [Proteobacteria bacterium]|nr:Hsp20/alpha crystallin family protein [Pseudomonadota bacterium]MBU1716960.1 Hsp20/alpha crystallin family protein [Pseudomonadota bacterium]
MYGIVPFRSQGLASVLRNMDEIFKRVWHDIPLNEWNVDFGGDWLPPVDLTESKDSVTVKVELPGLEKKDVDLTVNEGLLTIKGEKKEEKKETDKYFHRIERSFGSFIRTFRLPAGVKEDKVKAEFKDGVLIVTLPKAEEEIKKVTHVEIH